MTKYGDSEEAKSSPSNRKLIYTKKLAIGTDQYYPNIIEHQSSLCVTSLEIEVKRVLISLEYVLIANNHILNL